MEYEKYWHEGLAYQEKELFMTFLALKLEQRKIIRDIIKTYSDLNELNDQKENNPSDLKVKKIKSE